jgi:hypothetical protein
MNEYCQHCGERQTERHQCRPEDIAEIVRIRDRGRTDIYAAFETGLSLLGSKKMKRVPNDGITHA